MCKKQASQRQKFLFVKETSVCFFSQKWLNKKLDVLRFSFVFAVAQNLTSQFFPPLVHDSLNVSTGPLSTLHSYLVYNFRHFQAGKAQGHRWVWVLGSPGRRHPLRTGRARRPGTVWPHGEAAPHANTTWRAVRRQKLTQLISLLSQLHHKELAIKQLQLSLHVIYSWFTPSTYANTEHEYSWSLMFKSDKYTITLAFCIDH